MKHLLLLSYLLLGLVSWVTAQSAVRYYQNHSYQNNVLRVQTNDGELMIQPYNQAIIEVSFIPKNQKGIDSSHAVVLRPQNVKVEYQSRGGAISLHTAGVGVVVQKVPFQLQFFHKKQLLTQENKGFFDRDTLKGFNFQLTDDEALYGTGSRALPFNRRGFRVELYNKPHYSYETDAPVMNYNLPVVLSSKKYMLFFDNAPKGFIDLGKTDRNTLSFESIGGKMTYYFIAADEFYQILQQYTELTGKQPLPPAWAFGNFASRYGYRSEKQVRELIAQYKQANIPVSAVILDHYWYGEGEIKKNVAMGDLAWYRAKWQDGEKMVSDLAEQGVRTVLITQPFVLTNSQNYPAVSSQNLLATNAEGKPFVIPYFYFGETTLLDIFKPEACRWFWEQYKKHTEQGIAGWWGDLGEPEVHPKEMNHVAGKAEEVHNIFGHYWAKMIFEGYRRDFPMKRPFILMRAGFAGSQRFGLIPWSGDVAHSWGGFQAQPSLALHMNLGGLAYMHSDLGGFAEAKTNGKNDELYWRWLEYGGFQPIFRPHSQEEVPSEPIFYEEPTQSKARDIIVQRYRLFPYHYTLAYQNSTMGCPMMRPLFWEEPQNKELYGVGDTYLWGDDFLVAPILQPNQQSRKVYLPKNNVWYAWAEASKSYAGGRWYDMPVSQAPMPVLVRSGAFITETLQNIEKFDTQKLQITYFLDKSFAPNERFVYFDDGETPPSLSTGAEKLQFKAEKRLNKINLSFKQEIINNGYATMPLSRDIQLVVRGVDKKPVFLRINGKRAKLLTQKQDVENSYYYDASQQTIMLQCNWQKGQKVSVEWQ